MQELLHTPTPDFEWEKLQPMLDKVMHELKASDRDLILMRYFENRQLADIGQKLGLSEDAARKRVDRELPDRAECVRFLHRDITSWAAPEHYYDVVVTHFVLDCFPEAALAGIIKMLARAATADANWLLADFCAPRNEWARLRARGWLALMYLFFRVTARIEARELVDPTPFMQGEEFALVRQHLFQKGMLKSEMWSRGL